MELFFSYLALHTSYLFVFSIGIGLGLGASVLGYILLLRIRRTGKISSDEYSILRLARKISWAAICMYGIAGLGLLSLAYESMLALEIFYASMTIAGIFILNELLFSWRLMPRIQRALNTELDFDAWWSGSLALSIISWGFLTLHHLLYRSDTGYFAFMALYVGAITLALILNRILCAKGLRSLATSIQNKAIFGFAGLTLALTGAWYADISIMSHIEQVRNTITEYNAEKSYTRDDVASHNAPENCWLIIDDKVFDASEAARLHPAMFHCGEDASLNYHKNHGPNIRDKMMQYYIGNLREGDEETKKNEPSPTPHTSKPIAPFRELYVDEGSWDTRELLLVVEKDAENILAIDGSTHTRVGRIHGVGYQPHTSVFSQDARYMYIISRDGWLTKIDLTTLSPETSVQVGIDSRGTALTDDDAYIAVGNYEPGNLVILDAHSMEIVHTIALDQEVGDEKISSRAGAVVEHGNLIIVALKDANSVWIVDTDQPGFPTTHRFTDIGENVPALHDAFLTPDGRYYIVASQGSKTAWVLDLHTMEAIAEIETGETPHTGPGATWGKYIYVPSLGEGLITVIDTTSWTPASYIKTGGPGLFVRSYSKDPSYPYIWADTAFGDHHDEIYVIDGRSNKIVKTIIPVEGESSWHPEFTYDGNYVYVVSPSANEIEVYDAHTFEIVKRLKADMPSAISNVGLRIEEPGL
ncbi:MAG: cytochrome D1 domain-containing protein [Patescibacteria group bacterium]